jgi:hypothetical protein
VAEKQRATRFQHVEKESGEKRIISQAIESPRRRLTSVERLGVKTGWLLHVKQQDEGWACRSLTKFDHNLS